MLLETGVKTLMVSNKHDTVMVHDLEIEKEALLATPMNIYDPDMLRKFS